MENFKIWSTEKFGIEISEKQLAQFSAYQIFLQEQNQFMNLTAITETNEIWIKHFLDSISIELTVKPGTCLIDLGTGA
jgi:16S rRNA (guanine527-N7)-methyltransferase